MLTGLTFMMFNRAGNLNVRMLDIVIKNTQTSFCNINRTENESWWEKIKLIGTMTDEFTHFTTFIVQNLERKYVPSCDVRVGSL